MSRITVAQGLQRAARLIPFEAAGSSRLTGQACWVLTPPAALPEQFRDAQTRRTARYLSPADGRRVPTGHLATIAPRYIVISYGVPIAWVTLDGRTHYATVDQVWQPPSVGRHAYEEQVRAMLRHRNAIRASWPEQFRLDSMGDPMYMRDASGRWTMTLATV